MSDSSMRWPGADGSPGLDFSGSSTATSAPEPPTSDDVTATAAADAPAATPSGVSTPVSTPAAEAAPEPESAPRNEPVPPSNPAAEDTRVISSVSAPESRRSAADEAAANAFSNETTPAWQSTTLGDTTVKPALSAAAVAGAAASTAAASVPPPGGIIEASTAPAAAGRKTAPRIRRTRKARLRLARIDPWSVMKTAFLFSISFGVMMVVITTVLWTVLLGSGALEAIDQFLIPLLSDGDNVLFSLETYLNTSRVVGFSALVAAIDVVILTAVATLVAFLYNMAATLMGGLEVTLAED